MKKTQAAPPIFYTVSEVNKVLGLPKPLHPLVCLNDYSNIKADLSDLSKGMMMNLYKISYSNHYTGKVRYGQRHYDFEEGGLCFTSPNQLIAVNDEDSARYKGFTLLIHPDFIRDTPLAKKMKGYGFFSYTASEALHLSEKEKDTIMGVFNNIREELALPIDQFSQEVIIAQIELLLSYSNRFYHRQFITRNTASHDLLDRLEALLQEYFDKRALISGLPAVQQVADELHVSAHYLSDMLRAITSQNAQQYIHNKLMETAKDILSSTDLTIAEIAYQLGFEHPQSFHKLFKRKTNLSPLQFRQSFNRN